MKLRRLITAAVMASFLPGLSWAGNLQDDIVRELASQGFKHVKITTTWLGRMRFVATSDGQTREIIINGNTGEILRARMTMIMAKTMTTMMRIKTTMTRIMAKTRTTIERS
ncbi:MAG: hypothetical protein P8X50_16435 [Maritimibacter sp.]